MTLGRTFSHHEIGHALQIGGASRLLLIARSAVSRSLEIRNEQYRNTGQSGSQRRRKSSDWLFEVFLDRLFAHRCRRAEVPERVAERNDFPSEPFRELAYGDLGRVGRSQACLNRLSLNGHLLFA